jgi:hypothetical protein
LSSVVEQPQTTKKRGGHQPGRALRYAKGSACGRVLHHSMGQHPRHRWRVEGTHGTAKVLHSLARVIRRGLENMKIQALLTAIAVKLKKLANAALLVVHVIS